MAELTNEQWSTIDFRLGYYMRRHLDILSGYPEDVVSDIFREELAKFEECSSEEKYILSQPDNIIA